MAKNASREGQVLTFQMFSFVAFCVPSTAFSQIFILNLLSHDVPHMQFFDGRLQNLLMLILRSLDAVLTSPAVQSAMPLSGQLLRYACLPSPMNMAEARESQIGFFSDHLSQPFACTANHLCLITDVDLMNHLVGVVQLLLFFFSSRKNCYILAAQSHSAIGGSQSGGITDRREAHHNTQRLGGGSGG